jgi:hypothetical protein
MSWHFYSARDAFDKHREKWDELNKRCVNHILLDSLFVSCLIRHFASDRTFLGVSDDDRKPGMVILDKVRPGFLQTFQPSQAPLGLIVLGTQEDIVGQIGDIVSCFPGYVLGLAVMQQDPSVTQFATVEHDEVERLDYITTSRLKLNGTFEEYWKTRSHNLVHNLARQRRRFGEQNLRFELVSQRDAACVFDELQIYGRLESSGWKSNDGTAITAENVQGHFYRELLENFCGMGEGVIYRLDMNGTPIASALCVERRGALMVLKITYDENVPRCSPGLLLHEEMLKSLFDQQKVKVIEYYGRYTDWHRKWTDEVRTMYHINFYRASWVPKVRNLIKSTRFVMKMRGNENSYPFGGS